MALLAWAARAISSVRAPAIPCAAKCCSAAARMRPAVAGCSTFLRPSFIYHASFVAGHKFVLKVYALHSTRGIAFAGGHAERGDFVDTQEFRSGNRNFKRSKILIEIRSPLCARNGYYVFSPRKHPRQRELRGSAAFLGCNFLNSLNQFQVLLEVLALKSRSMPAVIVLRDILKFLELARQKTAAKRAVCDESNSQLVADGKDFVFGIARPQRVLRLEGRNGMCGVSAPDRLRSRFGESEPTNFTLFDQAGHCAHCLFDGHVGIDPMLIVEINRCNAKAPQARLAGLLHIFRPPIDAKERSAWPANVAKLGSNNHLMAALFNCPAHQFLVSAGAVHIGRVEQGNAAIDGMLYCGDRFVVVRFAIKLRHTHTAKSHGGDN